MKSLIKWNVIAGIVCFIIVTCPYFMPNEITFKISRYIYIAHGFLCLTFILFLPIALLYLLMGVIKPPVKQASIDFRYRTIKWLKLSILPLVLSVVGFMNGDEIFAYWQIKKFNNLIDETGLVESENTGNIIQLRKKLNDSYYRMRKTPEHYNFEDCTIIFDYWSGVIFSSDNKCIVTYCNKKPRTSTSVILKGENGYNWYRFCYP